MVNSNSDKEVDDSRYIVSVELISSHSGGIPPTVFLSYATVDDAEHQAAYIAINGLRLSNANQVGCVLYPVHRIHVITVAKFAAENFEQLKSTQVVYES